MDNPKQDFLKEIFNHILHISQGNNSIYTERLANEKNEMQR
ncbi:MAG: hypothetical protein ACI9WO_001085 [Sphingobacteriales bacterium]|jgi:hypothetical protein